MPARDDALDLFDDRERARRTLDALHDSFIMSGAQHPVADFSRVLRDGLAGTHDPDSALRQVARFAEAVPGRAALFDDLIKYPVQRELLFALCGSSGYFADILVRDPGLFPWLTTTDALARRTERTNVAAEVRRLRETFATDARFMNGVRRLHRREILRIGARDLLGLADLAATTADLSALADVIIQSALGLASGAVAGTTGDPPMAVIGLGKLGGDELNYSSDIDLLFVYRTMETGRTRRRREEPLQAEGPWNRVAERTIQILSEPSSEGHLYRVDMRLRPEAGAGPVALPLDRYLLYYESRGELWERQMLLKARVVAGDRALGEEFLALLEPFVYPRTFFNHPMEYVAKIKARIESRVGDAPNVKLMRGGIRDVEFVVQTLQLLRGGANRDLRTPNTLRALELLSGHRLLSESEAGRLADAYRFFRTVEHRLQMRLNTQTHTIPDEPAELRVLARQTGYDTPEAFRAAVAAHAGSVREVFERVLATPGGTTPAGIESVLDGAASEEAVESVLRGYGLKDPRAALRHLRVLTTGTSLDNRRGLDAREREAFRAVAPEVFEEIGKTPDPDLALRALTVLASSQLFPGTLYRLLGTPQVRNFVLRVCAAGLRCARELGNDALVFESIVADPGSLHRRPAAAPPDAGALTRWKASAELRAAITHILGLSTMEELTATVTEIADAVVAAVLKEESKRARMRLPRLAVFALGKWGSRELLFDADLDILFVRSGSAAPATLERLAAAVVKRLSAVTADGRLYEVDARLRPEGRNAPLVISAEAYASYLRTRASLWERQSLTRLRFVAGDGALGRQVTADVHDYVYGAPLPRGWVRAVVEMRRKTEARSKTRGSEPVDLKLGAGGTMDIEFIAQIGDLARAQADRATGPDTVRGLLASVPLVLSRDEREWLADTYGFLRSAELGLRMTLDERGGSLLPEGAALDTLARVLARSEGEAFRADVVRRMRRVRSLLVATAERLE